MKDEWSCVCMIAGGPSVMTTGTEEMRKLCATIFATMRMRQMVNYILYPRGSSYIGGGRFEPHVACMKIGIYDTLDSKIR